MRRKRFTEEQISGIQQEQDETANVGDRARNHSVSEVNLYDSKAQFGGLDVPIARRRKALEHENGKLKRLLADAILDNTALTDLLLE